MLIIIKLLLCVSMFSQTAEDYKEKAKEYSEKSKQSYLMAGAAFLVLIAIKYLNKNIDKKE